MQSRFRGFTATESNLSYLKKHYKGSLLRTKQGSMTWEKTRFSFWAPERAWKQCGSCFHRMWMLPIPLKLSLHWQMRPNQSLPSSQTGTEDRTVLYWTEVESGSAKAVEAIDPPVNTLHSAWPNLCWLLFVSVSSPLQGDWYWAWVFHLCVIRRDSCLDCARRKDSHYRGGTVRVITTQCHVCRLYQYWNQLTRGHILNIHIFKSGSAGNTVRLL